MPSETQDGKKIKGADAKLTVVNSKISNLAFNVEMLKEFLERNIESFVWQAVVSYTLASIPTKPLPSTS